jgi:hypothetical protein
LFVRFLVLVLSIAVLVLESIQHSNPAYWSASYREPPRSTIGIAAVRTAIEYEYRFTEYRFAEYEYDEIRCEDELGINPSAGRFEGLLGASISDRCHNQSSLCPGLSPCAPLGQKIIDRYLGAKRDAR